VEDIMQVREVMTPQVTTVAPNAPLVEIARIMRDEDIGSVPVAENEQLLGMVTDRDIVVRAVSEGHDGLERTAADVMSPDVHCCTLEDDVDDVLRNMGDQQLRRMPVVDGDKHLVGIVSLGDLSREAKPKQAGRSLKDISQPTGH
jgi:CBS domain-containing protein